MPIFLDALWDAAKDTLIVIPILYLTYLLVSFFSHNDNEKYSKILHRTNKAGPVIGAFLGSVPQCGFSSVMSNLYSKKMVTLGTLFAVFIATSDEALPLMISKPEFIPKLLLLMAFKVVYAIVVGYLIDGIVRICTRKRLPLNEYHDKHCQKNHIHLQQGQEIEIVDDNGQKMGEHPCHDGEDSDHKHNHCCATNIFLDALKHTAIIISYIFVATLVINLIRGYCGGLEPLSQFFTDNVFVQILFGSLIGLIPNCASSVFLVELYMEGVILFPALLAGLSAGAGIGLIVLFTCDYKKVGINVLITVILYIIAVFLGIITNFIPIW